MNRIRELRKAACITQAELCVQLGITQGALSGWENGKYEPDTTGWLKLSEIFNVPVDYLMGSPGTSVERVKSLCKQQKIPLSRIEKDLGYANGYIGQLKKGSFPDDRLVEIAAYLNVPLMYLLTGETDTKGKKLSANTMEFLKLLRKEKGLTQQEVANFLGVERSTYVKYERGQSDPPTATLIKLANFFGVSVDYLIGKEKSPSVNTDELSDQRRAVLALLEQTPDDVLDTLAPALLKILGK